MAARGRQGRQDRQKKAASAPAAGNGQEGHNPESQEYETVSRRLPAREQRKSTERPEGMTRKSALYLTGALCLLLGVYLGTLLPAFREARDFSSPPVQADQSQQAPLQAGRQTDDDGIFRELEERVKKNPQDTQSWIQLGNLYFDNDRPRKAIHAYEHALAIKGDNPDVLTDLGIMHRQVGEFDKAVEKFTQASKINPLHEQSRFNLGVVLFYDLNRKDEGRKVWNALVGINPQAKTPDGALLRTMLDGLK